MLTKKLLPCLLALLLPLSATAIADDAPAVSYAGRWAPVRESFLRVYLPDTWTLDTSGGTKSGLLAYDRDYGIDMRVTLAPAQERTMQQLAEEYANDPAYGEPIITNDGAYPMVLMYTADGRGIVAVTETGFVFTVTVTFVFEGAGEAVGPDIALEILRTLSEDPGHNG